MEINTLRLNTLPLRVVTKMDNEGQYSAYDYVSQEPYFEPASEEDELLAQLNSKLLVTEIPREDLKYDYIMAVLRGGLTWGAQ